jgi:hypothetical protein
MAPTNSDTLMLALPAELAGLDEAGLEEEVEELPPTTVGDEGGLVVPAPEVKVVYSC